MLSGDASDDRRMPMSAESKRLSVRENYSGALEAGLSKGM
jgi:hypothetical protein